MKKIIRNTAIVTGVFTALFFGWRYACSYVKHADNLQGLSSLQEDDLPELVGYQRTQLISVWGEPDDVVDENQDIWNKEGGECLIVTYTEKKKVKEAVLAIP